MTKTSLLVAVRSFEITHLWFKNNFLKIVMLLIWKTTVTKILSMRLKLELGHTYVIAAMLLEGARLSSDRIKLRQKQMNVD